MKAIGKFLRENGLYTMIANNSIHTNPPLCITEEQLAEGFEIIDRGARHRRPGGEGLAHGDRGRRPAALHVAPIRPSARVAVARPSRSRCC